MKDPRFILEKLKSDLGIKPDTYHEAIAGGFRWFMRPIGGKDHSFIDARSDMINHAALAVSLFAMAEDIGDDLEPKQRLNDAIPIVEVFADAAKKRLMDVTKIRYEYSTKKKTTPEDIAKLSEDIGHRLVVSCRTPEGELVINPSDQEVKMAAAASLYEWLLEPSNIDPAAIDYLANEYGDKVGSTLPFAAKLQEMLVKKQEELAKKGELEAKEKEEQEKKAKAEAKTATTIQEEPSLTDEQKQKQSSEGVLG